MLPVRGGDDDCAGVGMSTITQADVARLASIPDAEVRQDIADTMAEIAQMEREIPPLRALAATGDRMADFRASARVSQIAERHAFIDKLNALLRARGVME